MKKFVLVLKCALPINFLGLLRTPLLIDVSWKLLLMLDVGFAIWSIKEPLFRWRRLASQTPRSPGSRLSRSKTKFVPRPSWTTLGSKTPSRWATASSAAAGATTTTTSAAALKPASRSSRSWPTPGSILPWDSMASVPPVLELRSSLPVEGSYPLATLSESLKQDSETAAASVWWTSAQLSAPWTKCRGSFPTRSGSGQRSRRPPRDQGSELYR